MTSVASVYSYSLPPDVGELTAYTVTWEKWLRFNRKAEPEYAAAVTLPCWVEPAVNIVGGAEAVRRREATSVDIEYVLWFDGQLTQAQGFSTFDRFTVNAPFATDKPLQPKFVSAWQGPNFDNQNAWLIEVNL